MSSDTDKRAYYRSGELARLAGVSPDTLRHYERKRLIERPRRSANGYREYPASALDRVHLVRRALAVGFTLDELVRILAVRDRGGAPCQQVRALAGQKLADVETRLGELTALRDELHLLLKNWDDVLKNNPPNERAGLLESPGKKSFGEAAPVSATGANACQSKEIEGDTMVKAKTYIGVLFAMILPATLIAHPQHPADQQHNHRQSGVDERGDHTMGFSHEKTTHHFRLTAEGGSIEVTANDSKDTASIEQIRKHLSHISKMFKQGNFEAPMLIHGETPPGVPAMKTLKGEIGYTFEKIDQGGRVRVATTNAEAIEAIHEFLRYQIKDHRTGDPLEP